MSVGCPYSILATPCSSSCRLSLHDALPIYEPAHQRHDFALARPRDLIEPQARPLALEDVSAPCGLVGMGRECARVDRKSTRLNSSHRCISYAVFCLKKKNDAFLLHHHSDVS